MTDPNNETLVSRRMTSKQCKTILLLRTGKKNRTENGVEAGSLSRWRLHIAFQWPAMRLIHQWSRWRGAGGGFRQGDGRRSAGSKERMRNSSAGALELMIWQRPAERCRWTLQIDCEPMRAATATWNCLTGCNERPRYRAAVSEPSGSAAAARRPASARQLEPFPALKSVVVVKKSISSALMKVTDLILETL